MVTHATRELSLVRCTAGDWVVGVEVGRIAGVERAEKLARRPTAAAPGAFRTREGEWPVVALARWLGAGSVSPTGGQVVLFNTVRGRVGLLVDRVSPVERIAAGSVRDVPVGAGGRAAGLFSQVALTGTGPLVVLAVDALSDPTGAPHDATPAERPRSERTAHGRTLAKADRLLTFDRAEHPRPGGRPVVLAIPIDLVAEVFDAPEGSQLPGAEPHVREVVVWREKPLAVVDGRRWVGLPERPEASRRLVVARLGSHVVGLVAGSVVQVIPGSVPCVPMRSRIPLRRSNLLAALDASDQTIIVPDWSRLVDS